MQNLAAFRKVLPLRPLRPLRPWIRIALVPAAIVIKILFLLGTPVNFDLVLVLTGVIRQEQFCFCSMWQAVYWALHAAGFPSDVASFRELFNSPPWQLSAPNLLVYFILKAPFLLLDIATGIILMMLAGIVLDKARSRSVLLLWLLNPFASFLFEAATSFDILPILLVVVAVVLAVKQRPFPSALVLAVATYVKLFPILLAPILGILTFKTRRKPAFWYVSVLPAAGLYFLALQQAGISILESLLVTAPLTQAFPEFLLTTSETVIGLATFASVLFYLWLIRRDDVAVNLMPIVVSAFLAIFVSLLDFHLSFVTWILPLMTLDYAAGRNRVTTTAWALAAFLLGFLRTQGYLTPSGYSLVWFRLIGGQPDPLTQATVAFLANPLLPILIEPILRTVFTALSLVYALSSLRMLGASSQR